MYAPRVALAQSTPRLNNTGSCLRTCCCFCCGTRRSGRGGGLCSFHGVFFKPSDPWMRELMLLKLLETIQREVRWKPLLLRVQPRHH